MAQARGPILAYAAGEIYRVGQQMAHPSFGNGVVVRVGSSTVCTVVFLDGEKRLLMGTVARPS